MSACLNCGESLPRFESRDEQGRRFCSLACRLEFNGLSRSEQAAIEFAADDHDESETTIGDAWPSEQPCILVYDKKGCVVDTIQGKVIHGKAAQT